MHHIIASSAVISSAQHAPSVCPCPLLRCCHAPCPAAQSACQCALPPALPGHCPGAHLLLLGGQHRLRLLKRGAQRTRLALLQVQLGPQGQELPLLLPEGVGHMGGLCQEVLDDASEGCKLRLHLVGSP